MNLNIVKDYSVYTQDEYPHNFRKLYKGIIVRITKETDNPRNCWFSIKTKKTKTAIVKNPSEEMMCLVFNDADCSISCEVRNKNPKNKFPDSITVTLDEYNELKYYIPQFLKDCGCSPAYTVEGSEGLKLIF